MNNKLKIKKGGMGNMNTREEKRKLVIEAKKAAEIIANEISETISKAEQQHMEAEEIIQQSILKQKDAEKLVSAALESEADYLKTARDKIGAICNEYDVFCGLLLTKEDVLNIVSLSIDSKEIIKIPFVVYFNN